MAVSSEYLQFVLEQLSGLAGVTARRMFGGIGLYQDQRFFGIITSDTLYFKVNDANRGDYQARGMGAFRVRSRPHISMSYFELPADILEDADECAVWAAKSVAAATIRTKPVRKAKSRRQ
jgi:DNA transformation protein